MLFKRLFQCDKVERCTSLQPILDPNGWEIQQLYRSQGHCVLVPGEL